MEFHAIFSPMVQYSGSIHLEINNLTAKKSSFKKFLVSPIFKFCQSTNLCEFSSMVQYSGSVCLEIKKSIAKKSSFKNFSVSILQFCQSTNLRSFSPMVQYSGSVYLEINKSKAKISSFKKFPVRQISPIFSIYESTWVFTYGTIFRICTFGDQHINSRKIQL